MCCTVLDPRLQVDSLVYLAVDYALSDFNESCNLCILFSYLLNRRNLITSQNHFAGPEHDLFYNIYVSGNDIPSLTWSLFQKSFLFRGTLSPVGVLFC